MKKKDKNRLVEKLTKIYDKNVRHKTFLNENEIIKCMVESYYLGNTDKKIKIKNNIESSKNNGDFMLSLKEILNIIEKD